jgi:hypothetical protein
VPLPPGFWRNRHVDTRVHHSQEKNGPYGPLPAPAVTHMHTWCIYAGFHKCGYPIYHPFIDGISTNFHYKPSILGYSHLWKPPCDAYIMHIGFSAAWMIHKIPDHVIRGNRSARVARTGIWLIAARAARWKQDRCRFTYIYIYVYLDSVCRWKLDCRDIVCTQKFPELIQALVMHTSQWKQKNNLALSLLMSTRD